MKKLLLFIILLILLFTIKNKQHIIEKTNFNINDYIDTDFINNISKYPNFKKENLPKYYLQKDFTENYIYLLNKVNYPDFLKLNEKHQYIKDPIPLVTKKFILNESYIPNSLIITNIDHIERTYETELSQLINNELYSFIKKVDVNITIFSAYRSYTRQQELHNMNQDQYTALPGESEHQLGLAVDLSTRDIGLSLELENTYEYFLLNKYCYDYGFILRYPKKKEYLTGYPFEPWHYRYVGKDIAKIIKENNLTLEEYFYQYVPLNY